MIHNGASFADIRGQIQLIKDLDSLHSLADQGVLPLCCAAEVCRTDVANYLINRGVLVDDRCLLVRQRPVISQDAKAAEGKDEKKSSHKASDQRYVTALFFAVTSAGNGTEMVRLLLSRGANPDSRVWAGTTDVSDLPLTICVFCCCSRFITVCSGMKYWFKRATSIGKHPRKRRWRPSVWRAYLKSSSVLSAKSWRRACLLTMPWSSALTAKDRRSLSSCCSLALLDTARPSWRSDSARQFCQPSSSTRRTSKS